MTSARSQTQQLRYSAIAHVALSSVCSTGQNAVERRMPWVAAPYRDTPESDHRSAEVAGLMPSCCSSWLNALLSRAVISYDLHMSVDSVITWWHIRLPCTYPTQARRRLDSQRESGSPSSTMNSAAMRWAWSRCFGFSRGLTDRFGTASFSRQSAMLSGRSSGKQPYFLRHMNTSG